MTAPVTTAIMAHGMCSSLRRIAAAAVAALVVSGCTHGGVAPPRLPSIAERSDAELAKFLPALADYPWDGWNVVQRIGPPPRPPEGSWRTIAQPSGCDTPPYAEAARIAATTHGVETSLGPTGFGGEASVGLLHEAPGHDVVADTRIWAKRCANYLTTAIPPDTAEHPDPGDPTAVSVLPDRRIEGVDVLVLQLTDNREHRYQPEGTRESVVYVATVRGIVVTGRRHDSGYVLDDVFAATIRRLNDERPSPRPLSDTVGTDSLTRRSDEQLSQLLPSVFDLPAGWTVGQTSPTTGAREQDYEEEPPVDPPGCDVIPFMNENTPRDDLGRGFREIATATAVHDDRDYSVGGLDGWQADADQVRLHIEKPGIDIVEQTTAWARTCAKYQGMQDSSDAGSVDLTSTTLDGQQVYAVHLKRVSPTNFDFWTLLTRVRGILLTAQSTTSQPSTLVRTAIDHLRHAAFTGTPAPTHHEGRHDPFGEDPPGTVPLPAPSAAATAQLSRIATGALVDPEPYHVGGYLPGDPLTRSPDYLHFRSPTGSIVCTWRRYSLYCDVPHGTYPRTPKPAGVRGDWRETLVQFGWDRVVNGVAADQPLVYAESTVLPYGSTIRLGTDSDAECLMEPDGLTCISYWDKRIGLHLSRQGLTPLPVTDAVKQDTRATPR
jgi:hypothetical protein